MKANAKRIPQSGYLSWDGYLAWKSTESCNNFCCNSSLRYFGVFGFPIILTAISLYFLTLSNKFILVTKFSRMKTGVVSSLAKRDHISSVAIL